MMMRLNVVVLLLATLARPSLGLAAQRGAGYGPSARVNKGKATSTTATVQPPTASSPAGGKGFGSKAAVVVEQSPSANKASAASLAPSKKVDKSGADWALLFDCDGVIVETEELHRQAYNAAFEKFGLKLPNGAPVVWTVEYYDVLQNTVGGGKPKMMHYFNKEVKTWPVVNSPKFSPPPQTEEDRVKLVDALQDAKTEAYIKLAQNSKPRPGVVELMDAALSDPKLKVGICSAATKEGFVPLVNNLLGKERLEQLDVLIVGDDVKKKKPDPMIYNTAKERLGLSADRCVVIEDSLVGLRAAVGAGMKCVITYTHSTKNEAFYAEGAVAKVPDLSGVQLDDVFGDLRKGGSGVLSGKKDAADGAAAPPAAPAAPAYKGWGPGYTTRAVW
jgi:HAD superfamily hydrolase (TIGR01509 family)